MNEINKILSDEEIIKISTEDFNNNMKSIKYYQELVEKFNRKRLLYKRKIKDIVNNTNNGSNNQFEIILYEIFKFGESDIYKKAISAFEKELLNNGYKLVKYYRDYSFDGAFEKCEILQFQYKIHIEKL